MRNKIINTFKVVEEGETLFIREYEDGRIYYTNSKEEYHRKKGPAVTWTSKSLSGEAGEAWFLNGKRHREDGPAYLRHSDQLEEYCLNGEFIPKEEFLKFMVKNRIQKLFQTKTVIDT